MSSGLKIWEGQINLKASIVYVLNVEGGGSILYGGLRNLCGGWGECGARTTMIKQTQVRKYSR